MNGRCLLFSRILNVLFDPKMNFYAVAKGRKIGVFQTWEECSAQVTKFPNPLFKKFKTLTEAEHFISAKTGTTFRHVCTKQIKDEGPSDESSENLPSGDWPEDDVNDDSFLILGDENLMPCENQVPEGSLKNEITSPSLSFKLPSKRTGIKRKALSQETIEARMEDAYNILKTSCVKEIQDIAAAESIGDGIKRIPKRKPPATAGTSKRPKYDSVIWKPVGIKKFGKYDFPVDSEDYVIVYTDGSCIGNGKKSAIAGFGVYFSENHPLNTAKPVSGRATNNCGEIQASSFAIKLAKENGIPKLCISTDSQFLINSITKWISSWKRKNWLLKSGEPVKNKVDFMELDKLLSDKSIKIKWNYVKGHDGIEGNEKADKLARQGAAIYGSLHNK